MGSEPTVWRLVRHRGVWSAASGSGASRKRRSLGTEDRAAAERALKDLNELERRRTLPDKMTVGAAFALYAADRKRDGKDIRRIEQAWKPLSVHFETMPPETVSKADCQRYIKARRAVGVSDGGIRTELAYLSAALKHLLGKRAPPIQRTPAGRPRERYLTKVEARQLIHSAIEAHVKLWLILALATAGRPSHILQLTWARVDLKRRVIDLDDRERDRTAKGRARVPINDMALEALRVAREVAQTPYVIEQAGRAPIASVKKGVAAAAERAGLAGVTPYVLRHTAGVLMAEAGVPLAEIAAYMGHSNLDTTRKHYAQYHPGHLASASEAMNLLGSSVPVVIRTDDD